MQVLPNELGYTFQETENMLSTEIEEKQISIDNKLSQLNDVKSKGADIRSRFELKIKIHLISLEW